MPAHETDSLVGRGIKQGAVLPCGKLSAKLKSLIRESRAVKKARSWPLEDDQLLVILSQDCDIQNESDRNIEVLAIKKLDRKQLRHNDSVKGARNTRKLHLPFDENYWLCDVDMISIIPKENLLQEEIFEDVRYLPEQSREILITWRINRYARKPLPDEFNKDFLFNYLQKPETRFEELLRKHRENITDLYVFVAPEEGRCARIHGFRHCSACR